MGSPADRIRYCVRPNSGRIEPGDHVEVQGMELSDYLLSINNLTSNQFCSSQ